jgi:hypothetical protein
MADWVPTLRERLRKASPELAAELDLQWHIASSQWLPVVPPKSDSSNARPHLEGIEGHLDRTLEDLQRYKPKASVLDMRPIEMYLLRAAVLFHDLGRAQPDKKKDHGEESRKFLAAKYESFGIRNREVANSLGRICASHTAIPEQRQRREHELRLGDVVIDPYGQVRERMIAALLTLCDHMDCAQTRVVPDYLREEKEAVGAFRNVIRGVIADPVSRCIRTTLVAADGEADADTAPPSQTPHIPSPPFQLNSDLPERTRWANKLGQAIGVDGLSGLLDELPLSEPPGDGDADAANEGAASPKLAWVPKLKGEFGSLKGEEPYDLVEQLIAWNILYAMPGPSGWSRRTLVAVVMGDLRANRAALWSIREQLAAVGLPLATWLVDDEERLYTPDCRETFEPILHKAYLLEVARTMWELSTRVFGVSEFKYRELASQLGDRDVDRVRMAARRLAIVTANNVGQAPNSASPWSSPIWVADETWRWRVSRRSATEGPKFVPLSEVERQIEKLAEPDNPTEWAGD